MNAFIGSRVPPKTRMFTRTRVLGLAIVILASTAGWLGYVAYALSASNRNTVIPPGGGTTPCSWDVFVDGSNTDVKNCQTGDITYINADPTIAIQNANDNCPSGSGCIIFIEHGSYALTIQITGGTLSNYQNAGIQLSSGTSVRCENRNTVTFTGPTIPGGVNNAYWVAFVNKDRSTSDSHVTIENCGFSLTAPTQTATGLKAWEAAIQLQGCTYCVVQNNYIAAGSIALRADSVNENTATALSAGKNYGNLVTQNVIFQEAESSWLYQASNSTFSFNIINQCWDDCFLIASAGVNDKVVGNQINGVAVVNNKGAATAGIYLQNDNAVGTGATSGVMANNIVAENTVQNMTGHNAGSQGGIADLRAQRTQFVHNQVNRNFGFGIRTENCLSTLIGFNQISYNGIGGTSTQADGVHIFATETGTFYDYTVIGNMISNNGVAAQNNAGIRIAPNAAGDKIQDVTLADNTEWDDLASHVQSNAFRFDLTDTLTNVLIEGNNLARSPAIFAINTPTNLNLIHIANNQGYNPFGALGGSIVIGSFFAPWGTSATVASSTDYTINGVDMYCTSTGGTGVNINIKDTATNVVYNPGATLTVPFEIFYDWKINFGGFSVAPTVHCFGN